MQSPSKKSNHKLTPVQVEELHEAFEYHCMVRDDGKKVASSRELGPILDQIGYPLTPNEIEENMADRKVIYFQDLCDIVSKMVPNEVDELEAALFPFDNGNGFFRLDDLPSILKEVGDGITFDEIQETERLTRPLMNKAGFVKLSHFVNLLSQVQEAKFL